MKRSQSLPPRPTQAELEILRVLWRLGPSSVRDLHESLNGVRPMGYTTVLKLLQIMIAKGLTTRDESGRTHVYRAAMAEEETQRQLVTDLLERAFGGSASRLIQQALESKRATPEEMAEIRRLIDRATRSKP